MCDELNGFAIAVLFTLSLSLSLSPFLSCLAVRAKHAFVSVLKAVFVPCLFVLTPTAADGGDCPRSSEQQGLQ